MRFVFKSTKPNAAGLGKVAQFLREMLFDVVIPRKVNSRYKQKKNDIIITWGAENNTKLSQYEKFEGNIPHPPWTTDRDVVSQWFADHIDAKVLCRTLLNAHGGKGIVLAKTPEELVESPVYSLYKKKTREFRVHVIFPPPPYGGACCYITEKKKMAKERRPEAFVQEIRNHDNGWVFCHNTEIDVELRRTLNNIAMRATDILGFDIGAVDIGFHSPTGEFYVYEVNTQPGLDNTTAKWYADIFARMAIDN